MREVTASWTVRAGRRLPQFRAEPGGHPRSLAPHQPLQVLLRQNPQGACGAADGLRAFARYREKGRWSVENLDRDTPVAGKDLPWSVRLVFRCLREDFRKAARGPNGRRVFESVNRQLSSRSRHGMPYDTDAEESSVCSGSPRNLSPDRQG